MTATTNDRFPRTAELPRQTPLFWVEQKDRYLRQLLIRDIEAMTGRPLVVYYANARLGAEIDQEDSQRFDELFRDVEGGAVDLLLETVGGITDATEAILSFLRNRVTDLRVLVPKAAKSNGTLLCLAGRAIGMGVTSELGPIEPSLSGIPCSVLAQDEFRKDNFALHHMALYALSQTRSVARQLLLSGMMAARPEHVDETVQKLSSRETYFSHGSVIDHREAAALGLTVEYFPPGDPVWERVWLLYCMFQFDCERARYLKMFEGRSVEIAVAGEAAA